MTADIEIIGGGIGGLCAALACQQHKLSYRLWEKEEQIGYRRVGLGISRNIFPLLDDWGILEETKALGAEVQRLQFVNRHCKLLRSLSLKAPALSVDREKFTQLLSRQLPKECIRLSSAKEANNFPRSSTLIVAEGIQSPIRHRLYPQLKPRSSHQLLWRGMLQLDLPASFHHTYVDFIGGNRRFAIIHSGGNVYSWYAVEINGGATAHAPVAKPHLLNIFKDYHPVVHRCIENTENIYHEMLQDLDPSQRKQLPWHHENLVFLGDSIHATTPNLANGACLAMEDAWVLVSLLKHFKQDRHKAFALYQALREKKVNSIVRQSWLLGKMMHQSNPLFDTLNLLTTRLMPQWTFEIMYKQVLNNTSIKKVKNLTAAP